MTPLFLFSLPRSGSTLLQRMLAGHSEVTTAPEPWFLLPFAAMNGVPNVRVYADYSHRASVVALEDLARRMPGGREELLGIFRAAAMSVYGSVAGRPSRYFLDKTPRYFLIIDFILELFPDAKAVVLLRNPLDVLASVISSWGHERLWIHNAILDLYKGPRCINDAFRRHSDRLVVVEYDDLVRAPQATCERLATALDLAFEPGMLTGAGRDELAGSMGDETAKNTRGEIVESSVARWKHVLATPLRRAFARRYLRHLGADVLRTFGQNLDELEMELDALPVRWRHTVHDGLALAGSFLAPAVAASVIRELWIVRRDVPFAKLD